MKELSNTLEAMWLMICCITSILYSIFYLIMHVLTESIKIVFSLCIIVIGMGFLGGRVNSLINKD